MNSCMKPKCSIRSTRMRKTRKARCNIGFTIRAGRIRKCDLCYSDFFPIVKLGTFTIVIHFTPLFNSAETPTSPFLVKQLSSIFCSFFLSFLLLSHTIFFLTISAIPKHQILSFLPGRGLPSLQWLLDLRFFHCTTSIYTAIFP